MSHIETGHHTLAVAFVTDISERKQAEAALLESNEKLRVLTGRLMSVQDEESKRISRELHDAFSQELAALSTESRLLKRELPSQAQTVAKKMEVMAQRIGGLATNIHQMSRRLHPSILDDLGLAPALRAECNAFSQLHGIRADFIASGVPKALPANIALCLYRVAQEGLQNVGKHSAAKKVSLKLVSKKGEIQLTIEDFGDGFDLQAQKRRKGGLGLVSMEERVRFVGGTLVIDSKPGRGTKVQAGCRWRRGSMRAKILLADDHTIVTEGLRALLEPEFQIIGTVDDGRAAIKAVKNLNPDVVILDISMPLLNGIDAAREIRKLAPKVKIVFLTMHTEMPYIQEAFEAGASAFVIKHSASIDLLLAIRKALLGRTYITPTVAKDEVPAVLRGSRKNKKPSTQLTARQREVLQLLAEGRSAKEAASILNLSPRTVEFHKYRLMQQLGLETTAQLLQFAIKHRIISG